MKINDIFSFSRVITEENLARYIELSRDNHPLHTSVEFAHKYGFKKNIVPGMLVATCFSELVGVHLPDRNYFYLSQTLTFHHPLYVGTMITVSAMTEHISETTGIATLKSKITDKFGKLIISGQMRVKKLKSTS